MSLSGTSGWLATFSDLSVMKSDFSGSSCRERFEIPFFNPGFIDQFMINHWERNVSYECLSCFTIKKPAIATGKIRYYE